jgi:hypothetical protein
LLPSAHQLVWFLKCGIPSRHHGQDIKEWSSMRFFSRNKCESKAKCQINRSILFFFYRFLTGYKRDKPSKYGWFIVAITPDPQTAMDGDPPHRLRWKSSEPGASGLHDLQQLDGPQVSERFILPKFFGVYILPICVYNISIMYIYMYNMCIYIHIS